MKHRDIDKWRHHVQVIPLQIVSAVRSELLTHPKYRTRDTVELFHEAKQYVLGRLPINSREMAIAVLLSRDIHEEKYENLETLTRSASAGM